MLTQKPIETSAQSYSARFTVCSISAEKIIETRDVRDRFDGVVDSGHTGNGYSFQEQKETWITVSYIYQALFKRWDSDSEVSQRRASQCKHRTSFDDLMGVCWRVRFEYRAFR